MPPQQIKSKRRRRLRRVRDARRRPINVAASMVTTMSLYCGLASIFASIGGDFEKAAYWILGAIVLDTLDGTVARLTKSVSDFGKELDSLCDAVSAGVAPAVLIYCAYLQDAQVSEGLHPTISLIAIVFTICGVLRLARYNVYQSDRRESFIGLPIPAAAGTVASFALFTEYFDWNVRYWIYGPLTLVLAFLMVSTVRYPRNRAWKLILAPRHAFQFLVLFVGGIALFHYARQYNWTILLLPLALAYVLFGIVEELIAFARRMTKRRRIEAHHESGEEGVHEPEMPVTK